MLSKVGRLVKRTSRAEDIAGRYGGDEFCILLPHTTASEAAHCIERIRRELQQATFEGLPESDSPVTASFGVAELCPRHGDENDLLVAADSALYRAKRDGGNRIAVQRAQRTRNG